MASATDPLDRLSKVYGAAGDYDRQGFGKVIFTVIMLPIITFADKLSQVISAVLDLFIVPTKALIDSVGALILSIVGGAADIVGAGSAAAAEAFLTGIWGALGPFAYAASIGAVLVGAYLLVLYTKEEETSDFIPFTLTDFPLIGADEEGGD